MRSVLTSLLVLLSVSCAARAPFAIEVTQRASLPLASLEEETAVILRECDEETWLTVLPCSNSHELSIRCIQGQLQLEVRLCGGWDDAYEQRVGEIALENAFHYSFGIPERGCAFVTFHADNPGDDAGERIVRITTTLLGVGRDNTAWVEWSKYADAS